VTPTKLQLAIFAKMLDQERIDDLVQGSTAESLALITLLTKISNSPILLKATADKAKSEGGGKAIKRMGIEEALRLLPERARIEDISVGGLFPFRVVAYHFANRFIPVGKLIALAKLLKIIREVSLSNLSFVIWAN
jgi:hypothetical protein